MSRSYRVKGLVSPYSYGDAYLFWLNVPTPAAGAAATFNVPGEYAARVVAAHSVLTTDANAANRLHTIDYIDGKSDTYLRNGAGVVVTASTTAQAFEWSSSRGVAEWAANTPVFAPIQPTILYPGFQVKFQVSNIQVADQLSALRLLLECFPTGGAGFELGVVNTDDAPAGQ